MKSNRWVNREEILAGNGPEKCFKLWDSFTPCFFLLICRLLFILRLSIYLWIFLYRQPVFFHLPPQCGAAHAQRSCCLKLVSRVFIKTGAYFPKTWRRPNVWYLTWSNPILTQIVLCQDLTPALMIGDWLHLIRNKAMTYWRSWKIDTGYAPLSSRASSRWIPGMNS